MAEGKASRANGGVKWGVAVDLKRCTGCQGCTIACKLENGTPPGVFWTRVIEKEEGTFPLAYKVFMPIRCNHCSDAPCIPVCTPHAMTRDPATGWVNLDQAKCIGCKMCVHACPFGNAVWDALSSKILKCDYCGGDPACAKFCPTQAIRWVDDVTATQTRKRAFAAKFKEAFAE